MTCQEEPYNIDTLQNFYIYKKNNPTINEDEVNQWIKCIATPNNNLTKEDFIKIRNDNKIIRNNNKTSEELNNYSMYIYSNDLNYTFGKILFFIILAITYIYFFKATGIMAPIMKLINYIKDKITTELPNIKKNIENNIKINPIKK
jgi:hypothetical protein